jgi:glycogen phosphorylase
MPRVVRLTCPTHWTHSAVPAPYPPWSPCRSGSTVWLRPWLHVLQCPTGGAVPILLLDTDISENDADDRSITGCLHGGDATLQLKQEIVLGIGGEMSLQALGFEMATYHLNEGHAALLALALLRRYPQAASSPEGTFPYGLQPVRVRRVFTTHTPVDAGHDKFGHDLVHRLLGILSIPRHCAVSAAKTRLT